ncbi:phospholipase D-like domain-containing protein [Xanthobacter tagetidis]|uniref:Phospholipase D n=1 Tax=Xanthobacter tagetidis TaxID=60216 RepID=A0A3L7ACR4_9HYPH|nr:phospholipase D-like domain-containing protein [Xanthobacter tagetidis]MBB6309693.1 phosphatidylserine/phosphatidylglycerophosphate/cardiolipin synthase-like enzyme [Xanthobacter tagetidis]RLP78266.1 phosphatidylserine synthase [Xanthobacter tagetidis]
MGSHISVFDFACGARRRNPMDGLRRAMLLAACAGALHAGLGARGALAQTGPELHFSPSENLQQIDLGLIASARTSIDMTAFFLRDHGIADALVAAARRGVAVRLVVDGSEAQAYDRLAPLGAGVRRKPEKPIMHLKAYVVDGAVLRTGSANFSTGALKKQDNDLLILRDPPAVALYRAQFERIWANAVPAFPAGGR